MTMPDLANSAVAINFRFFCKVGRGINRQHTHMSSLPNYLRTHRKRHMLSQEEVAFLLGVRGMNRGIKVCRDENYVREPSLETALAYETIYGVPVRQLFAGVYERAERNVAAQAKLLSYRTSPKPNEKLQELVARLTAMITKEQKS